MKQTDKSALASRLEGIGMVTPTLGEMLKDVSNLDTAPADEREQIEYIDIERIEADPGNFYNLSGLDELAAGCGCRLWSKNVPELDTKEDRSCGY